MKAGADPGFSSAGGGGRKKYLAGKNGEKKKMPDVSVEGGGVTYKGMKAILCQTKICECY